MRVIILTTLLAVFVLSLFCGIEAEQISDGVNNTEYIWNGTWTCPVHYFFIKQNSPGILGSYYPRNPEVFDTGILEWTLSKDGKTYEGTWVETVSFTQNLSSDDMSYDRIETVNPQGNMTKPAIRVDNATRVGGISDPEHVWAGTWTSARKTYTYTQNGSEVIGTNEPLPGVKDQPGVMEATVSEDGKTLIGNWTETGYFNFTMSEDRSSFNGSFTETLDPSANKSYMVITKLT